MKRFCLFLSVAAIFLPAIWPSALRSQESAYEQGKQAFLLEQQGRYDLAIHSFEPLVDSDALSSVDRGRAWTLLGYAYREIGQFQKSQNAYEQALHIFEHDAQHAEDYANVLDSFAGFYRSTGQLQTAVKMWSRVLTLYKEHNNCRAMARVYTNLAALAMEQKRLRQAKSAIENAVAETKLTDTLTDDDFAFLYETQAWISDAAGDRKSALAGYERALELRKHAHGQNFPLTGWSYLILGRAYAANGQTVEGLSNMRTGLAILEQTEGRQTPRYLAGETIYAQALDQSGSHEEASHLKVSIQQSLHDLYQGQCIGCTVSAFSFR